MKIAICGMAEDPRPIPEDHQIWVIAGYIGQFPKADRAFECHEYPQESDVWKSFVNEPWCEFYVPEHLAKIYPKASTIMSESMADWYFRSFGSTIAYMLVQAIYQKLHHADPVEEITLYGVTMEGEEYKGQQPSAHYWLGVANGLGIKTTGLLKEETYGLSKT